MKNLVRIPALPLLSLVVCGCNPLEVTSPARPIVQERQSEAPAAPQTVYPSTGRELIVFVTERHPERLAAGVTQAERVANMEFLRDQVITAGICGGMDLARNLKRGKGPHSIDAIAWRRDNGWVDVVDIAAAYDDTDRELSLHWLIVEGPSGWDPVPQPECP